MIVPGRKTMERRSERYIGERVMRRIPLLLTSIRAALAPVVVILALFYPFPSFDPSRAAFGFCLVAALLTDVFDGILARRLGIATPGLRRLDSVADSLFYAAATFAAWRLYPSAIAERLVPIAVLVVLEIARYAFDAAKFRREASYHMWSSKLWGLALFAAYFALLACGSDRFMTAAILIGIAADLEGLAISVVLRSVKNDVPTLLHAIRMARDERA
jgi:CDP-diacylglycerol--glycerol-3-phosphate 3-phosphatidyltransferase